MTIGINQRNLFSTPVWEIMLEDIDNVKLLNYALSLKNIPGTEISNMGGYQSHKINYSTDAFNNLGDLISQINNALGVISEKFKFKKPLKIIDIWVNINETGNFNMSHIHPGATLSGVYYVKTNGTGNLEMLRSKQEAYLWQSLTHPSDREETWSGVSFIPKENKVIIFPSWVDHAVAPCEGQRVSIAFNAG